MDLPSCIRSKPWLMSASLSLCVIRSSMLIFFSMYQSTIFGTSRRIGIHADDHLGAGQPRVLDQVEPDAPETEYHDVRARLDLGGVDHRADTGGHAAADVAHLVERRVL